MKLLKIKHIIPLSAAAITFVCSQSTAEASTIHTVKRTIHFGALVNNTEFQYNPLNRLIIKETIKPLLANSYIFQVREIKWNHCSSKRQACEHFWTNYLSSTTGDSLETIAKRYNVTVQSIKQINNTVGNKLYTGQHLKINSSISQKEKDLMARLVTAEAGGESYKGKVAVAKVILNRVNAKGFPNTITGVIYEPIKYGYAFTPVTDGRINQPASAEAKWL